MYKVTHKYNPYTSSEVSYLLLLLGICLIHTKAIDKDQVNGFIENNKKRKKVIVPKCNVIQIVRFPFRIIENK